MKRIFRICLSSALIVVIFGGLSPFQVEAAISVTVLDTEVISPLADDIISSAFTPANNSLIVVLASSLGPGPGQGGDISGGSLAWTSRAYEDNNNSWSSTVEIFTAPVTTGASMQVTYQPNHTGDDAAAGMGIVVLQITGHSVSMPVAQTFTDGAGASRSGVYSANMNSVSSSTNYVFTVTASDNDAGSLTQQTTGNGWTQVHEEVYGSYGAFHVQQRTASSSANVRLDNFAAGYSWSFGAIEIRAATSAVPTLTVSQPDGTGDTVTVGDAYAITYDLADSDDTVTAKFFYDTNSSGLDGTAISGACASAAEGTGATCSWDTTGMTPGSYYVYATTTDAVNPEVSDYSPGQIIINAAAAPVKEIRLRGLRLRGLRLR